MALESMVVHHLSRKAFPGQFSIEGVFGQVRKAWTDPRFEISSLTAPCFSKGIYNRLKIIRWAMLNQACINHITGDIHFAALAMRPRSTILTIHDCYPLKTLKGIKRRLLKWFWFDLPCKRVGRITVVSKQTQEELERYVPAARNKVTVVPNAVSPIYTPQKRPFAKECPRILQIGFTQNKNLERLFCALEGLTVHLNLVGNISEKCMEDLQRRHIPFTVYRGLTDAELYKLYCDSDIVSFPSTYEGFGLPIIEAQWVERPVVTSNCSSMPEVAGEGACLVDPFSIQSIRAAFVRVMNDDSYRESVVQAGIRNRTRFTYAVVAQQYANIYAEVASDISPGWDDSLART